MEDFTSIFERATEAVPQEYFLLDIAGGDQIFRERVYCYELYHQLRSRWPNNSNCTLNGELDKGGHPIAVELVGQKKPDFLIHKPGAMHINYAIMEVKHDLAPNGLKKDIETLESFKRYLYYERAIYLIYGNREEEVSAKVQPLLPENLEIELWIHSFAGTYARRI